MPQVIAAIGAAITAFSGAAASATIATAAAAGLSLTTAVAIGNAVGAVIAGAGVLFGSAGVVSAVQAWGTVALLASTALRPAPVGRGAGGTQVDFQADPLAGIPLILGRSGTAGKVVHANTSGQANKNIALFYLLALSSGPVQAVESMSANEFGVTYAGTAATAPPQYVGSMLVSYTPGAKPDPVAYYPPGVQPAWIPEWTAAHKLSGVACAWWTLVYDVKSYPTGMPKPLFVVRGPAVYDPRLDSTYPGGSGGQRWNDEATWGFGGNENPFLQGLAWLIGRRDNGLLSFGVGAPIEAIDVPAFVEGANVADANGWKVGGEVLSSDRKWDVLRTILQAGGGEPMKLAGKLSCVVRTPRVVLTTLTGRDVIGDVSITGTKRRRDRFNQIIPTYRSEDHAWELVPAGPVKVDTYVAADGGLRSREGVYTLVQQPKQAAELAAYDILDAREFEPVVLPLGPKFAALKPGDCIALTEPEFGMSGQPLVVQTREIDPASGRVTLTLRSETSGKHEYALGRSASPPPISGLQPQNPAYVSQPDAGSWVASAPVLVAADGSQVPIILVTGACNDPNVSEVLVEWRYQFSPGNFGDFATSSHPQTVRRIELRAVVSGGTYNVRVRYKSVRDAESALFLDLGLVTVSTLISHGVALIGGQTPAELQKDIDDAYKLADDANKAAAQTAKDLVITNQNLYDWTTLPDGTKLEVYTVNQFQTVHTDTSYSIKRIDAIGFMRGDDLTFQMSDSTLYADATTTWVQYRNSLQTNFDNVHGDILTEANIRSTADGVIADRVVSVSTRVGDNEAAIVSHQSSIDGLEAEWVMSVKTSGPGFAHVSGIRLAADQVESSLQFIADKIGFTNGTGVTPGADYVYPLAIVDGRVIATHFQADDIRANTITVDKIVSNSIAVATVYSQPLSAVLTNAWTVVAEFVAQHFGDAGGTARPVDIAVYTNSYFTEQSGVAYNLKVYNSGGGLVASFPAFVAASSNKAPLWPTISAVWMGRWTPPPGVYRYSLEGLNGGGAALQCTQAYIIATEQRTQG